MDHAEAKSILASELSQFAARDYHDLVSAIKRTEVKNVEGGSGAHYQIEFTLLWDSQPGGDLRIIASIDDGGWRAVLPLTDSVIVKPDGTRL